MSARAATVLYCDNCPGCALLVETGDVEEARKHAMQTAGWGSVVHVPSGKVRDVCDGCLPRERAMWAAAAKLAQEQRAARPPGEKS